jgi:S1-C subfamily serine protease
MLKQLGMVILGSVALSHTSLAIEDEEVFKEAIDYTVKIQTRVDIPFLDDNKGAFTGAGFLVDAERGWIMTNAHVVARSPSHVSVAFRHEENSQPAEKIYIDPYLDLAILKLPKEVKINQKAAPLECGTPPSMGHPVGALGHPWGIFFTGTRGVISGTTDKFDAEFLQTDAPINAGNSGGPLISMKTAKVVGINTASINKRQDQNTNFATPMKYACRVLQLLQKNQDPSPPKRPFLFLTDLDDTNQLIVANINPETDLIALQNGDRIDEFLGEEGKIQNESHLIHALRGHLDNFTVRITRQGRSMQLSGKISPAPKVTERQGVYVSGVLMAPWGIRDWPAELKLSPLVVHSVETGSIGDNAKINFLDILIGIDGQPINNLKELFSALQTANEKKQAVKIKLKRSSESDSYSDRYYDYLERSLTIEDLKYIGPSS